MSAIATAAQSTTASAPTAAPQAVGFLPVAWIPERDLDIREWARIGQRLGVMGRCNQWWIGDWIRYGDAKYGEKYSRAAKLTGYDVQTLTNYVYVATSFADVTRRRETISWSHHEAVAALEPAQQDNWLTLAAGLKWAVKDLRDELRARRAGRSSSGEEPTKQVEEQLAGTDQLQAEEHVRCPHCGQPVPRSLFADLTTA
jgi:hypothetical protein